MITLNVFNQFIDITVPIQIIYTVCCTYVVLCFPQEVCEQVWTTLYDYPSLRKCTSLKEYIKEAVRLAWALTAQSPGYLLEYDAGEFLEDKHTRFHSSDPDSSAIKQILWPVLLEGSNGPCVYKGVVIT